MGNDDVARHAFLKQQLTGLNHRFAMEPGAHLTIMQRVRDGNDGHALVMGHEIAYDRDGLVFRQSRTGEIEGFVETVAAQRTHLGQAGVVQLRTVWINHGRKTRCIGRDHHVFGEAAFKAETGYTEIGILVSEFQIAGVIGGLRNAPRNIQRPPVGLLAFYYQMIGLLKQAAERCAHHQRRH